MLARLYRFGAVGVAQNGASYAASLLLIWLGLKAWQATAVVYPLAVSASFMMNRAWTFRGRRSSFPRYVAVYVLMYPVIVLVVKYLALAVPPWAAVAGGTVIGAVMIYSLLELFVFRTA